MAENEVKEVSPTPVPEKNRSVHVPKAIWYGLIGLGFLVIVLIVGFVLGNRRAEAPNKTATSTNGTNKTKNNDTTMPSAKPEEPDCVTGTTLFQDKSFGAQFCYPTGWGTAAVNDAKVAATDAGHREVIRFSANSNVVVGGTSDDWSTTVGRGVGCLEPDNVVPALSAYNTTWHDIEGSGTDISYAVRSLPSSVGGYSIEESVSDLLISGVCVHGHKVINGSRYRVAVVNYAHDFAPAAGITTPAQHMAEPNVLFSSELRVQYDAVLASLEAY